MKPFNKSIPLSKNTLLSEAALSPFVRRFVKHVQNTVHKFSLWQKGDSFVVCVSGGADSVCLLDMLFLLSKKYAFTLSLAHVNYHLRGASSLCDEIYVQTLAKKYKLPCFILSHPTNKNASEETLRDIRYSFFETVRAQTKSTHIAIAHNQDDQTETLLLRLLRGAGLSGLSAMRPKNNFLIRPLIEMSRADILLYLRERHITFHQDRSNADPRYMRNRIRHTLIPYLEKHFQPQTRSLLAETALSLGDDYVFLEQLAHQKIKKQLSLHTLYSRTMLLKLPQALLTQTLRETLRPFCDGKNPEKGIINEIMKTLKSHKNKPQTITFRELKFVCKGDTVRLLHL